MRLGRKASLLVVFLLIISAAIAYAEDADIDSEPIPLDSRDPRYSGYLSRVREMIKARWSYPCVKNEATRQCEYKSAKLVVIFAIAKDGRVVRAEVQESSGYGIYDGYAVNAINSASPFPPVPPELMAQTKPERVGIRVVAAFNYVLVTSDPKAGGGSYYHARRAYFDQVREHVKSTRSLLASWRGWPASTRLLRSRSSLASTRKGV